MTPVSATTGRTLLLFSLMSQAMPVNTSNPSSACMSMKTSFPSVDRWIFARLCHAKKQFSMQKKEGYFPEGSTLYFYCIEQREVVKYSQ
jgi:hypothetical protein